MTSLQKRRQREQADAAARQRAQTLTQLRPQAENYLKTQVTARVAAKMAAMAMNPALRLTVQGDAAGGFTAVLTRPAGGELHRFVVPPETYADLFGQQLPLADLPLAA